MARPFKKYKGLTAKCPLYLIKKKLKSEQFQIVKEKFNNDGRFEILLKGKEKMTMDEIVDFAFLIAPYTQMKVIPWLLNTQHKFVKDLETIEQHKKRRGRIGRRAKK